jgi:hypothetical protein
MKKEERQGVKHHQETKRNTKQMNKKEKKKSNAISIFMQSSLPYRQAIRDNG